MTESDLCIVDKGLREESVGLRSEVEHNEALPMYAREAHTAQARLYWSGKSLSGRI